MNDMLQQIYSQAKIQPFPSPDQAFLSIAQKNGFLWIPRAELSKTEEHLLLTMATTSQAVASHQEQPWFQTLFANQIAPEQDGAYRVLQFMFPKRNLFSTNEWEQALQTILPNIIAVFFVTKTYAVAIEKQSDYPLSAQELSGLFVALDSDFDSYSQVYVGHFYPYHANFSALFQEEATLFSLRKTNRTCYYLSSELIYYLLEKNVHDSLVFTTLYDCWFQTTDFSDIILALWKHQGNLSSTAKELFMHRNTLQYKIDKFQQLTLLNVKEMDDLFLAYLLVSQHSSKI